MNEGELTLPPFLANLARGEPKHVYRSAAFPDMALSPAPLWSLLNLDDYASMSPLMLSPEIDPSRRPSCAMRR